MLSLLIPSSEIFIESTSEVIQLPETVVQMEHSLISLSKWESAHKKPFLVEGNKTEADLYDYFYDMIVTPKNIDPKLMYSIGAKENQKIMDYINDPMTATTFGSDSNDEPKKKKLFKKKQLNTRPYTSELIYYYMIAYNIPAEFEKWHLNRLLTLIRVCEEENNAQTGGKKMSKREILKRNAELNARRRAMLNTKG